MSTSAFASTAERSSGFRRARVVWVVAGLIPAIFLFVFLALTFFAAPEHDDYCIANQYVSNGLVQSVINLYNELSGRVVPFVLLQVPAAIASATGTNIVFAYSLTMATGAFVFLIGTAVAIARAWPCAGGVTLVFVVVAFAATIVGASPSVRDLLYWLPAAACYVPPALASILILGECVRALDQGSEFSKLATVGMAAVGLIGSLCNEFTGVWLVLIIANSAIARRLLEQKPQVARHVLIATAILFGWVVVVLAKGNSIRMGQLTGAGDVARSLHEALRFSLVGLGRFFREPAIIGWLVAVAAVTLAQSQARPPEPRTKLLALGVAVVCLACCYFEYFTHEFSTGGPLVERAQNQALMLLLFGITLSVSLLVRAYRPRFGPLPVSAQGVLTLDSLALPAALTVVMAVSILLSSTASLVRAEGSSLYPYWRESVERDRLLSTSSDEIVTVAKHRQTPSMLMTADVTVATGCVAAFYKKARIIGIDPPNL
ncbi:hypothetical protein IVA80_22570 [Bradyrhizobium sp. 139]|uniref:DUF6056 family protein n=1 Tax=Bradyrhizobium sp. 139 TaxID=2782616 RepID=UPI001FF9D4FB|nr:DUF6056 family protein [Bradyrhizobium sp. 139]MCK1743553.1 hypothetical protein [Bradyrhizobium sp. 139]